MRSRNIKPGFFTNEDLVECDPLARILFAGLWCLADSDGRLEDRPRKIKMEVLPCDDCDIEQFLGQLQQFNFIARYVIEGKGYIQVQKFKENQNPHPKERSNGYPEPPPNALNNNEPCNYMADNVKVIASPALPSLPSSSLNPIPSESYPPNGGKRVRKQRSSLSIEELSINHIAEWLEHKRAQGKYLQHDEHFILEYFKNYCQSKGKTYDNPIAALRNAFEWDACQPKPDKKGWRSKQLAGILAAGSPHRDSQPVSGGEHGQGQSWGDPAIAGRGKSTAFAAITGEA